MDLITILMFPEKAQDVCCLCFKKSENTRNLHEDIEIHDENYFEFNSTLGNIINNLFPSQELLTTKICEDCSTIILKTFLLLQKNCMKNQILNYIIDKLNKETDNVDLVLIYGDKLKKCKLKVNLKTDDNIHNCSNDNNFECEKCPTSFKSKLLLNRHIELAHKTTNNAVVCDVCGKIFMTNSKLKVHLDCHQVKQCLYCLKTFKSRSHFNLHVKSHTLPIKVKSSIIYYNCIDCDFRSLNKSTLDAHKNKYHLHIKPYACEICNKGFYKKDHLTQHLRTHKKIKQHVCDICGVSFVIERTLNEHLQLHRGQKPFKCKICNLGFINSGRRHEHMKRNHTVKNECCCVCGKKFALKRDLNTHLKRVHHTKSQDYNNIT